ncbi:DUF1501 domain-containing protein [Rubripirellula reticaptiva]|uniref:Sulfatase n=1 Tax=Rubripirellula reticaptiva TaxID=2528013 RepID=A0A5C6FE02_9BACT|nr:DUF1501 domain-containing protein [Rubripirellula reticaptiva]TWU57791.1 hypothetical protein Poly59_07000 [Rubripirellula reticaptiva]
MNPNLMISRRHWLKSASASVATVASSGWLPTLSAATEVAGRERKHCILLWMSGGPSQIDTFDMKPKHGNGGSIKEVSTSVPGIRFSEHLPRLAKHADSLAILRGVSTKEGDHQRGATLMRTGFMTGAPVNYPSIGCSLSKALVSDFGSDGTLPAYVTIAPGPLGRESIRPGFLGPKYAATAVEASGVDAQAFAQLRVDFLDRAGNITSKRMETRLKLWRSMQQDYLQSRPSDNVIAHDTVYRSAIEMMNSDAKSAFDLSSESNEVREKYGRGSFGQGCLMARRLIERGAPLVEVTLGDGLGWDTHADNFAAVGRLCEQLDRGWATLMDELRDRDLLERTTILWAGEFGRTPQINNMGGRDHYPQAFTCVLAGGGVAGGQAYGETSKDGREVVDGKMDQKDLLSTLCGALGVNPSTENIAEGGRPIAIADGQVIDKVVRS